VQLETLVFFLAGIALLIAGAEVLVRGASRLASAIGVSPVVIGLTVVAFGTSSPELAVGLQASLVGEPDIVLGNVVGSNVFNVLFILGLSAAIAPLVVAQQLVRFEVPLMIGVSVLLFVLALDGRIGRLDGLVLTWGIVGYCLFAIRQSLKESPAVRTEYEREFGQRAPRMNQWLFNLVLVVIGLAMLILGSQWLISGAVALAEALGVSKLVVALTIVAAGTSLPEVATSVVASMRGERDIAVGNVVGSNLFNMLAILGLSSVVATDGIRVAPAALGFDIPVMIAVSVACLPIFFTGYRIARWEGLLFLAYYVVYTLYLILDATQHDALPQFSAIMGLFVIPLTLLTLAVLAVRALKIERWPKVLGTLSNDDRPLTAFLAAADVRASGGKARESSAVAGNQSKTRTARVSPGTEEEGRDLLARLGINTVPVKRDADGDTGGRLVRPAMRHGLRLTPLMGDHRRCRSGRERRVPYKQ
jgi:cation:H+ antiporter